MAEKREKLLNVISLEFTRTKLDPLVESPTLVCCDRDITVVLVYFSSIRTPFETYVLIPLKSQASSFKLLRPHAAFACCLRYSW